MEDPVIVRDKIALIIREAKQQRNDELREAGRNIFGGVRGGGLSALLAFGLAFFGGHAVSPGSGSNGPTGTGGTTQG